MANIYTQNVYDYKLSVKLVLTWIWQATATKRKIYFDPLRMQTVVHSSLCVTTCSVHPLKLTCFILSLGYNYQ